ncbi:MAG TPA: alpha/beta hydrolase [Methylomirabilota bacterium]|jgi:pimeloyl-ACP methyl ester carboxylesterase
MISALARAGRWLALFAWFGLALAACASPVGTNRTDPKVVLRELGQSATTTGEPTWQTRNVLFEQGMFQEFEERPEDVLAALHKAMIASDGDPDLLFALAELSFLHGQAVGKSSYELAAAVYAYAFLFPEGRGSSPGRFDPRLRIAADLYNWALMTSFLSEGGAMVIPRSGTFDLPFGKIDVAFDPANLRAGDRELYQFTPISELEVYGLAMRYRWPGVGAPLAALSRPIDASKPGHDIVAPRLQVPLTALLRVSDARTALVEGKPLSAQLELHLAWDGESVKIAGEDVPLENEPSAALALTFTGTPIMELEMLGFLGRVSGAFKNRQPLVSSTPYRPGLIPVVFVHGTASSVVRWAEMYNRLLADPEIRSRYQFWFFQYDSGNPIPLSALRLREALTAAIARIDPDGKDPALRRMVLIGHSQGGLLVKMQAISSGDRLWSRASATPLERLTLTDKTRALFKSALFVEPLPEVSRVVFICTPHRGSFVAGRNFIANITRRLLSIPLVLTDAMADLARNESAAMTVIPSAVDNMSPRNRFIQALQEIPVTPSVTVNSIVAVEGDGPVEDGDDGVVKYSSAHIEPVESELIVKSSHSTQGNPHTIEEVRRILRLHAGVKPGGPLHEAR